MIYYKSSESIINQLKIILVLTVVAISARIVVSLQLSPAEINNSCVLKNGSVCLDLKGDGTSKQKKHFCFTDSETFSQLKDESN